MVTFKVHRKADENTPGAEWIDKVLGWWVEERTDFTDLNLALDFLLDLYEQDPESIRAWHEPFYFRGVDARYTGNGDTTVIGGKPESLEGWKLATVASMLARNHIDAGRKLKRSELAKLRSTCQTILASKQLTYEQGRDARKTKLWR